MKIKFAFFLCILHAFAAHAQQDSLFNPTDINIDHKKLLIIGEKHYIQEFHDVQYRVIEHLILQNPKIKNFQLLLERGPDINYYLDKLILEDDSISLKEYYLFFSKSDTLSMLSKSYYDFFMKFYYLSKSLKDRRFQFNCYDDIRFLSHSIFTIFDILKKYPVTDSSFVVQISFLDSLLHDKKVNHDTNVDYKFSEFHQHFGSYFTENREKLKKMLTENDFYWISEIIRRSTPPGGHTVLWFNAHDKQNRENRMFEEINNNYNDSTFFFCIIGALHVNKPYPKKESQLTRKKDDTSKVISVGEMLETCRNSHFKNKIMLCKLFALVEKNNSPKEDKRMPVSYPPVFQKYQDYLNSLLTGNITLIEMRKTKIKHAHKIMDYLLVVKEANSML